MNELRALSIKLSLKTRVPKTKVDLSIKYPLNKLILMDRRSTDQAMEDGHMILKIMST